MYQKASIRKTISDIYNFNRISFFIFRNSYIDCINFHTMVWVDASGRSNATNVEIILDDGTNNVIFDFDDLISGTRIMGHARIESWIETLKDATRNRRKIGISYDDSITDPYSINIDDSTTLAFSAQKIYDIHNHS